QRSVTAIELETARTHKVPVRILLASENWPGKLWEAKDADRDWVKLFRANLNQIAVFFDADHRFADTGEPIPGNDFRYQVRRLLLEHAQAPLPPPPPTPVGAEVVFPGLVHLLADIQAPAEGLLGIYQQCAPPGWAPLGVRSTRPLEWCAHLVGAPRQG